MALKDCKFFADINGRQVEMDFDEFRAYLLQDNVMATLAPDLTGKRGKKAGFTLTAQKAETTAVKAKAVTAKAEAPTVKAEATATKAEAPSGNVVTVTAEPADAQRIADSVKTQKPDAQGFTKPQRTYLVEKAKEVYKEAQEASESTKFVIKVPGDGQFTVKTPTEANSLHRRLTGDNVPGVDAKDTVTIGKAGDMKTPAFRWALQAMAPSPATAKPFSRGLFKYKKGEFETEGSGAYPIELHGGSATVENILPSGDYITDGYIMVLRSAVTPAGLKKVKLNTSRKNTPNLEDIKRVWDESVKDATVPAEIAGVFQSETETGAALIDGPKGIVALNPDLVKSVLDLVKPDGVMVTPDSVEKAVIFTKNGKPVGVVMPFNQSSYKEGELEAALAFTKQESTSRPTLPLSAESLRKVQPSLSKDRAEALIQVLKAMGLPFDRIKLAKGEAGGKGALKQADTKARDAEYVAAVRAGDTTKAQRMFKEAAKAAAYNETGSHGLAEGKLEGNRFDTARFGTNTKAASAKLGFFFGSKETAQTYAKKKLNVDKAEEVSSMAKAIITPLLDVVPEGESSELDFARDNIETMFSPRSYETEMPDNYVSSVYSEVTRLIDEALFVADDYDYNSVKELRLKRALGETTITSAAETTKKWASKEQRLRDALGKAQEALENTLEKVPFYSVVDSAQVDVVLQMKNPFVYDQQGKQYRDQTYFDIIQKAKEQGHDSVIIKNTYDGGPLDDIKVVFDPTQIKSADPITYDNNGNVIPLSERFDPSTPNIQYQKGKKPKAVTAITGMTPQEAVEYFKKAKLVRPELAREILSKDVPEHLKPVTEFIFRQRQKFLDGKMTVRDVAKAYIITVSSIQAGAIGVDAIKASTGQTFPEYATMRGKTGDIQIRPEDAVSAWLLTPDGKKALDSLEQTGKVDGKLWQPLIDLRQAYGNNTLKTWAFSPKSKGVNLYKIEEMTRLINQTGGNPRKLEGAVQRLVGIKDAKAGFIKHLLGFGDTPTVDAREINFWLTGQADISSLKTKGAEVARAAKDAGGKVRKYVVKRIGNQIKDLAKRYDMDVNVGAHIVHHWLWDATSNEVTTHAVMMDAMELAQTAYHATRGLFAPEPGFPNGRFRLDKVNTGLGAQSFGHGIYIAEGKAGVTAYTEMLEEDAPGSVVYELDVPDGIVAKLAIYEKPLTPNQFAALKSQVQSTLGEKGSQAIAGLNRTSTDTGDLIERIQDAIDGEDAGRQTSEIFSKAGIPGVKVEVSKDFGENKSFYVIWNQAALDRIALMKANEKPLQTALETTEQEEETPPLGSIEFIDDLNAVISTFEGSNESTILHEGFHFYRRHMLNEANGFTQAEVGQFNDWAGAKDGVWTVAAEEKAARGFEKYLRTGLAPTPELKKLFQKVAKWLREVYKTLQGSEIDIEIPDNIRRIFDRIFTLEAERQKGATGTVQAETSASTGPARLKQEKGGTSEGPVFVDNVIEALKTWAPKGTPEQLKAHLTKVKGAVAEADWIGLPLFLEGRRSVTRGEVEQFVKDNQVTVREVVLNDEPAALLRGQINGQTLAQFRDWLQLQEGSPARKLAKQRTLYSSHTLNPKAPAYRELLFLIPPQGARIITTPAGSRVYDPQSQYTSQSMPQEQAERELQERLKQPVRKFVHASHYRRAKNSVVHVRFNERALTDGTKVLFIEEIQSDWAQAKRQGRTDLSTPFQDTSRWTMLAFKRILRWATDNQYDKIAWTTGNQQATRWGGGVPRKPLVRTDVDRIEYKSTDRLGELKNLTVHTTSGKVERYNRVSEETIISEFGEKVYKAMPLINEYGSVNVKELREKLAAEGEPGPSLLSEMASLEAQSRYDEGSRRALFSLSITYKDGTTELVENQSYDDIKTTYGEALADLLFRTGDITLTQEQLDKLTEVLSSTTVAMLKYYDQIVPTEVAKYVKPFEGKVTRESLETGQGVHVVNVTEKMRKLAREGQALFQEKGKGAPGEPSATDVFRQKQAEARRKAAEAAMNRLRQATKEGQTKQASPASTTTTPPPKAAPSQPKAPKPPPSRPSTAGASTGASGQAGTSKPKVRKTIEQEVKDAIDRARKGKANPNNLPLDERLQRSIRGFADRFARRMVEAEAANIYQPDITLPDGSVVDRQERFEDSLHDYAKAFLANDADGVTKMRAVLEKILPERPPKPKVQKTAAERIKAAIERAERAANRKAASLTVEERIDREVKAFADRFAKRMVWAKKAGTYTDDVILPDGTVVDRQTFFEQAVNDFMTAYQAGNMAGVSLAKSHMNMATEQVPPDVGFGIHSLRSPLSYSNVVGSYEGVMGPLGVEVSTTFKRFHQEVALKQKTMGEALATLRKVMRENYFPAMRDAGFYGMESIVTSHIDYIQAINNFSQNYRKVQESARLFKNPSKFVKSRLEFAKQANMISGSPQSNGWPMAASFMKAAVYLTKLKFNPKSALMNYSQVFLSAGPYFSPVELVAIIGKSHRPSVRNRVIDGMRLVDVAVRTTGGREVDEGPRKTVWDYLDIFRYSSEQTRVIGYLLGEAMADRIAADRAAKKDPPLLAPQRQEIIRDWIEKIEFDNSPWNVAPFFRERGLKGALFQFKPFVQKNVERLYADIRRNPTDYVSPKSGNAFGKAIEKALPESVRKYTKLIGYQVVIGGVGSVLTAIPVAKPIAGYLIYAGLLALAKSFGDDEEAEKAADAIYYGAPALVGVDLSNSVGYVETPHGKNIYEQLVNEFLGPAVSTTANIATQGAELYAEMNKPTPLGRPEQKAAKVERRVWDIAKAVTPTARPVEMAVTMARGKQPELYLDKPTPLTRGEKIGRSAAFNPLRQSKFFEEKGAMDWQKRLAGKVTENPEIKRLEGEPDAKYARRQKMYQSWKPYYTRRMLSEPDFRLLSQEDKDAVLDNLKRNMVEETTKVSPDTDKFDAEEIIKRRLKRRQVED